MANNSIALGVDTPDFGSSFSRGAAQSQDRQMNSMKMEAVQREQGREEAMQLMNIMGSIGLGAMDGKIDGQADPEKWEQGLDYLDSMNIGLDTKKYRGKPQLARLLVDASVSASDRLKMAKDDREFQLTLEKFDQDLAQQAESTDLRRQGLDIQRQRLAATTEAAATKAAAPPKLSATEMKAVHAAEDELPNIDSSISQLERALVLNDKAYSGYTAGTRGAIGAKLPDAMVPDAISDPDSASATSEYQAIMTGEAATAMSAALKGATTDRELSIFMDIIGDVTKPPEVRKNAINRLLELARAKKTTATNRIQELKGSGPTAAEPTAGEKSIEDMSDAELEALINGQ